MNTEAGMRYFELRKQLAEIEAHQVGGSPFGMSATRSVGDIVASAGAYSRSVSCLVGVNHFSK